MKFLFHKLLLLLVLLAAVLPAVGQGQPVRVVNLKTEYTVTPLGMDVKAPRFSWQMESALPGARQTAYQVEVRSESGEPVWDSGKRMSDASLNITYAGKALQQRTRYTWTLQVWDQQKQMHQNSSWFETGLAPTATQPQGFVQARWIGGDDRDMVLYSPYLPVFKLRFSVQLDEASRSKIAGFVFGANDPRLLDKNKNIYGLQNKVDSSYIRLELNIAPVDSGKPARLAVYRTGYAPTDRPGKPLKVFNVPQSVINQGNQYGAHRFYVTTVMGATEIYLDGQTPDRLLGRVGLNPLGQGGDYIAFPVLADIGYWVPPRQTAHFLGVEVANYRSPANTLYQATQRQTFKAQDAPVLRLINPSRNAMPMLRTVFNAGNKTIRKARLYATARGAYDMYLNGKRVGDDYLNPGLSQYNKTHFYQTFDVTGLVTAGKNAMGAILGEGWWSGGSTYTGNYWNFFGDRQSLLTKLIITYRDGSEQEIYSDPEHWRYYNQGPVVYGSLFQGEVYDARREAAVKGWATPGYDDKNWKPAVEVLLDGHISTDHRDTAANIPVVDDYSKLELIGQVGPTIKAVKKLTAQSVQQVRPGVFVYDLGQNMAGVPEITLQGLPAGEKITLRFAEVKYPDLPAYKGNVGMMMLENIRAAMAQEIYLTRGGRETIQPRFTYHGFRYIEVTGIDKALPLTAVKGVVLSSVHEFTADYQTSNPQVNRLWQNIQWSMLANFMSVPTDCPQRNERLGWSGDISVFSRTATYLAQVPQFLRRHMMAMRDVQRADGRFTDVAPLGGGFGDILWGSAGITVAWESFQQYADTALLREHYAAMQHYMQYLATQVDTQSGVFALKDHNRWASLGDWLSPQYNQTEKTLLWEAYYVYDLDMMSRMAEALNNQTDAAAFRKLHNDRKAFFNQTYVDRATGKTAFIGKEVNTQTSYAVPLALNVIDDTVKNLVIAQFAKTINSATRTDDGQKLPPFSLATGFIGTAWVSAALSNSGHSDLAYRQLQQTTYPSWLYPVKQGATTIWERLNSYTVADGFGGNNNMNSFNHYSFGAVGAWMQSHSLGIQRDEQHPGFKHFIIAPETDPSGQMTFAKGHYDSPYGRIASSWAKQGNYINYHISIPANTTAMLVLPSVIESKDNTTGTSQTTLRRMRYAGKSGEKYVYELDSGSYDFKTSPPAP